MYKKLIVSLLPLILISGCKSTKVNPLELNVASPSGAPALAFYKHFNEEEKLDINSDPANVIAHFNQTMNKDIIVAPTNAGVQAIVNQNAPYKIAATVTFGNFFLAATGKDTNNTLDADDYVVIFQQNNVPGKLFNAVYGNTLTNVHNVTAASDAAKCLITSKNESDNNAEVKYVLLAEPAITNALAKNTNATVYADIQALYKEKYDNHDIMQASIFVSNNANTELVNKLLNEIKGDIASLVRKPNTLNNYVKGLSELQQTAKMTVNAETVINVLENGNGLNLGYKKAFENKAAIDDFLSLWNIGATSEEIYSK